MTIASNHDWHQLVPITYHIHKQQILYLKHLLHLPPTTQLYKVIRGYITTQLDVKTTYAESTYYRTIERTIKYCDLPGILEECAYEASVAAHRQRGTEIEDYRQNQRAWPTLLVTLRKNKIRNKLKEIGKTIFMTAYRNHQLCLDEEDMTSTAQNQQGNETLGEDATISTNSGSAFSAYDNLEEELNRLTRAQLRTRLHEEAPDICNNGRRGDILRRLIRCIREKEEWTQQEDQVIQEQNVNIEVNRIFGNDVVAGRHEVQGENI